MLLVLCGGLVNQSSGLVRDPGSPQRAQFVAGSFLSLGRRSGPGFRLCPAASQHWSHCFPLTARKKAKRRFDATENENDNKFGFGQRIDSLKSLVVGAIAGSVALLPFALLHDVVLWPDYLRESTNQLGQWEYDLDAAAVNGGLFAIVYRYCIRTDRSNDQLRQGVIMAFTVLRSTSRIVIPAYCTAIPLTCGDPTGYLDYNLLLQLIYNGIESYVLFGCVAKALDSAMTRGLISTFPE
jgi:hypothetical protein